MKPLIKNVYKHEKYDLVWQPHMAGCPKLDPTQELTAHQPSLN